MITGAILWAISGADLDGALAAGTTAEYLEAATARRRLLAGNRVAGRWDRDGPRRRIRSPADLGRGSG
jgi:hypothetical protein